MRLLLSKLYNYFVLRYILHPIYPTASAHQIVTKTSTLMMINNKIEERKKKKHSTLRLFIYQLN